MLLRSFKNLLILQIRPCSAVSSSVRETTLDSIVHNSQLGLETRLLKVAIIGLPNSGKSTLINNLMDRKVCPTSLKVHTTRHKACAIFTEGDTQIVFVDTPGLVNEKEQKRYNLDKAFLRDTRKVTSDVDIIGVLHDVGNIHTRERLDIKVINILEKHASTPSFLVLNKVDVLKSKRKLLDVTRQITKNHIDGNPIFGSKPLSKEDSENKGWLHFGEIFMVSALNGDGIEDVKNYLVRNAKPGEWMFPHETWTDQTAEGIITQTVQAALLDFIPQEIPYNLKSELEYFNVDSKGHIRTVVIVHCPNERISKLVAGAGDGKLRQITAKVQSDLQQTFHTIMKIKIVLKYPDK